MPVLVLASGSPRRRELLLHAGLAHDVDVPNVDETRLPGEPARALVERVARLKAAAAARRHPHRPVLGADTVVVVDDDVLGKPADRADAGRMMRRLSGRQHEVLTGVAVVWEGKTHTLVEQTDVWMCPLSEADLAWYLASDEPLDKAGAYAIQGLASRFVTRIHGSQSNVVGLPVAAVVALLARLGLPVDSAAARPYPER